MSQQPMGTAVRPASTAPASWDAFTDVDAFAHEVLTALAAMADGTEIAFISILSRRLKCLDTQAASG